MGWRGLAAGGVHTQEENVPQDKVTHQKETFCYRKYIEDVKQDQKDVPDLVESIVKPTGLAKEELRRIWYVQNESI